MLVIGRRFTLERTATKTSTLLPEKIILGLVLFLANLRALVFIFLFPDTSRLLGPAWIEIMLWMLAGAGVLYLLARHNEWTYFLTSWRRNWLLALFLLLAFFSSLWSVNPLATVFRSLELFFATLIASYFGMRLGPQKLLDLLFWFGAILLIFSIALVYGAPPSGTMYWAPFQGAWRGVYWHRNHLASITAFLSIVYLLRMILAFRERNQKWILDGIMFMFSLLTVYFTRSATGYILLLVLTFSLIVVLLWLWLYPYLKKSHYLIILGTGILAGILILMNLDSIFGLFNRDATMTGRVGLWSHLLDLASERLWLGHGFGAVWTLDVFREQIRHLAGWTSQPLIADNGFLDIFLHLGLAGLVIFIGVLALAVVRSLRYALTQKTLASFLPLLVMVYALFGNITFSLFAETEVFVWFLIVAVLFMTTPASPARAG